jgi:ornithine cyclodeaminase/alanine dehydrogenase-like protein (mu-crystallin family)
MPGTLEAKLVAVFPGNHERGLPSHQALIALFDEETGAPLCVMDGTVITAVRTGATAAVAGRALAREGASSLAVLGAGVQGRSRAPKVVEAMTATAPTAARPRLIRRTQLVSTMVR